MTLAPSPWLPEAAFIGPAAVEPVARALADWSAEWLASARLTVPFAWQREERPAFAAHAARRETDDMAGFRLLPNPRTDMLLAGAILDRALEAQPPRTAGDTALIRDLVQTAQTALSRRIASCLASAVENGAGGESTCPDYILPVALNEGSEVFTLSVPAATLIAAARARAGIPRKRPALARREEALSSQRLGLAAVIGRNRVALPDLEKLGRGDVIPLDTGTVEWLDLCIGKTARVRKAASIALTGNSFEIRIERPTQEW